MQTDDLNGNECDYDNAVYDKNIMRFMDGGRGGTEEEEEIDEE